ncbi:hypothetical protein, partial [Methylobacterium sp. BTF04]|uniref:hypothetical protein n=1 Tax=Methylobacterium sp. BTF04 TaxID=2708300 RepID=UPI001952C178
MGRKRISFAAGIEIARPNTTDAQRPHCGTGDNSTTENNRENLARHLRTKLRTPAGAVDPPTMMACSRLLLSPMI